MKLKFSMSKAVIPHKKRIPEEYFIILLPSLFLAGAAPLDDIPTVLKKRYVTHTTKTPANTPLIPILTTLSLKILMQNAANHFLANLVELNTFSCHRQCVRKWDTLRVNY